MSNSKTVAKRPDGRAFGDLRPVMIKKGINPYAEGSAEVSFGQTKVLVTASVESEVPRWLEERGGGWITAEYGMLPRSTHTRSPREAAKGKQSGRTQEIQRLIGRSLRAAVDLSKLDGLTVRLDCDVIWADGGTRTAAISGAWVALWQALEWAKSKSLLAAETELVPIAAVSVGVLGSDCLLDLCYLEDSSADFDCNLVFSGNGSIIEVQGTGEERAISRDELLCLLDLGEKGVEEIFSIQQEALCS